MAGRKATRSTGRSSRSKIDGKLAYEMMQSAERVYLLVNGWYHHEDIGDCWENENFDRFDVTQGHAVNIQKQFDRIMWPSPRRKCMCGPAGKCVTHEEKVDGDEEESHNEVQRGPSGAHGF